MKQPAPTFADRAGKMLDAVASAISPAWGARRQHDRLQAKIAVERSAKIAEMSYHDHADNDRLRGSRWIGSKATADAMLEEDLSGLREESRELARRDSVGGVIDLDVEHVVNTGFTIQAKPEPTDPGSADPVAIAKEFERILKRWSRRADRSGKRSLWKLSRLVGRCIRTDGECLTVMSDVGRADKPVPLAIEIVDIARLETPPEHANDKRFRLGVEYDAEEGGNIVAYHIRKAHPYDGKSSSLKYDRVVADRVLHIFEPWFAEQSRGYPWMTRVKNRIRDAEDIDEAAIVALQVQACFSAFVTSPTGNPLSQAQNSSTEIDANGRRLNELSPAAVQYLKSGEDVKFAAPNAQNSVGPLQEMNLRRIAVGMNVPYEFLMRDWRGLSFAGGRLVLNGAKLTTASAQKMLAEEWFAPIYRRVIYEAVIVGATSLSARDFARDEEGWTEHACTPPKWSYSVNPVQEVEADLKEVDGNLATLEEKIAARGGDLEERIAQRVKERRMLDEGGLLPQPAASAPTKPAKAGKVAA